MDLFQATTPATGIQSRTFPTQDWRATVPTVSQLTRRLRGHLENTYFDVWVRGEISGLRKPSSGHAYLILKDAGAQIRACLFRPVISKLKFQLEDGMEALVHGRITVYESRGEYQIVGDAVEPVGTGALQLAFEQLKAKLLAEGLFAAERKKPLPLLPRCIGIVTSPTGAAVRDILNILNRRFPRRELLILPTSVQGDRAASEIVAALRLAQRWNQDDGKRPIEVLIVGRGGGSLEDLWPFNEESVARALAACPIPVISAVGHETDFTIADFVADLRAPTPSAAAELVLPKHEDLVYQVQQMEKQMVSFLNKKLEQWKLHLTHLSRRVVSPQERLAKLRLEATRLTEHLLSTFENRRLRLSTQVAALIEKLNALSPLQILARGFTLTQRPTGEILRSVSSVKPGDSLMTRFSDGTLLSEVLPRKPLQG